MLLFYFLLYFIIFLLGLAVGSFLNCIIYRLETNNNISGRSFCENCKKTLTWNDLLPLVSFLLLQGKCRYCKARLSVSHPLVELLTGIVFFMVMLYHIPTTSLEIISLLFMLYISSSLIIIFIYDLKHYIIPDKVLLPAIVISLIYMFFIQSQGSLLLFLPYFLAGVLLFLFFFFIFFISKGTWLGFGDVKFVFLMGIILGLQKSFLALFFASLVGSIFGIALILLQKKHMKSVIPFGPFLASGTFFMMVAGQGVVQYIFNTLSVW